MKNFILIVVAIFISQIGCSMCCGPFDNDYGAFGGKHLRADRSHGRVGSILSDPITSLTGPSADSNLSEPPELQATSDDDLDDDDDLDLDQDDLDQDDLDSDDLDSDDLDSPDLEPIEPLRAPDTLETPGEDGNDSTASTRWRPRPLR